jgi:sugar fermentation stimulation protein A
MQFAGPLVRGTLIQRYKRFLGDIEMADGETVTAHCANPGSMMGLAEPGSEVWLSPNRNPKAKLDWRWELVRVGGYLVGINTSHPNAIVAEAIETARIPELAGYTALKREVRYGQNSRIDILLEDDDRPPCYVEIKSITLKRGLPGRENAAEFPDAVTKRGAKHLVELGDMVENGARAVMLYLVQREDCDTFCIADDIDPGYAAALDVAVARGVETLCYACDVRLDGIEVTAKLPIAGR